MSTGQRGRDSAERLAQKPKGLSSKQRAATVTHRVPEAAQCLRGLTQRPGRLIQCFSFAGEGFMGQVF